MATNFEKIREFKGKVAGKFVVPDNYRRWVAGANKLLKLHYRMTNCGLLWPKLVNQLQIVVRAWRQIGDAKYRERIPSQYYKEFKDIEEFDVFRHLAFQKNLASLLGSEKIDTFVEEKRERVPGLKCHFCNVRLVYPAYIVHRANHEQINKSEPIGIMCLHNYTGKLEKLMAKSELQQLIHEAATIESQAKKVQEDVNAKEKGWTKPKSKVELCCLINPATLNRCRWCGRGWCDEHYGEHMLLGPGLDRLYDAACSLCASQHRVSVTEFMERSKEK